MSNTRMRMLNRTVQCMDVSSMSTEVVRQAEASKGSD